MAEFFLRETVRCWALEQRPGDEVAAERTAAFAAREYAEGASVTDACQQARGFLGSWSRHPSHSGRALRELPVAS